VSKVQISERESRGVVVSRMNRRNRGVPAREFGRKIQNEQLQNRLIRLEGAYVAKSCHQGNPEIHIDPNSKRADRVSHSQFGTFFRKSCAWVSSFPSTNSFGHSSRRASFPATRNRRPSLHQSQAKVTKNVTELWPKERHARKLILFTQVE
jgi:hypothetical protein